ncbi:MAG TPA: hypothetical protein VF548_15635 [Allosphingosinicella sp.]|jgi:hypothetical protein
MGDLAPGQRVSIQGAVVEMSLEGPRLTALGGELGTVLIGLDSARRSVESFPVLDVATRQLRPGIGFGESGQLRLDLTALPADLDRLLLILFLQRGPGQGLSLRDFGSLAATFGDWRFDLDLTNRGEAALILAESIAAATAGG